MVLAVKNCRKRTIVMSMCENMHIVELVMILAHEWLNDNKTFIILSGNASEIWAKVRIGKIQYLSESYVDGTHSQ